MCGIEVFQPVIPKVFELLLRLNSREGNALCMCLEALSSICILHTLICGTGLGLSYLFPMFFECSELTGLQERVDWSIKNSSVQNSQCL